MTTSSLGLPPYLTKNPLQTAAQSPNGATLGPTGLIQLTPGGGSTSNVMVSINGPEGLQKVPLDVALGAISDMRANDPSRYARLEKLVDANGFSSFEDALEVAAFDLGGGERSWEQFLGVRAQNPVIQAEYAKRQGGGAGGPTSSTNTQRNLSSVTQAGAVMDATFRSELGRTGTKQEAVDFQKALNEQQSKNPTVSRTNGYSDGRGSSTSSTVTTGGFDPTRFAQEYARSQDGYAERFAGVSFMKILDDAISNPSIIDKIIGEGIGE